MTNDSQREGIEKLQGGNVEYGRFLRETRVDLDLNLRQAAGEIGLGHSSLAKAEKGKPLGLSSAIKVVEWLSLRFPLGESDELIAMRRIEMAMKGFDKNAASRIFAWAEAKYLHDDWKKRGPEERPQTP